MKTQKLFDIATLSDRPSNLGQGEGDLGIGGLLGTAIGIFNSIWNLFGRTKLTDAHLREMFPGNGYWIVKYRQNINSRIEYLDDNFEGILRNVTSDFIRDNRREICPECDDSTFNRVTYVWQGVKGMESPCCNEAFSRLLRGLDPKEGIRSAGGLLPFQGGGSEYVPYIIGGIILIMILKKK